MTNNNIASHPYDASINEAVEVGFFSNSDAVSEVPVSYTHLTLPTKA